MKKNDIILVLAVFLLAGGFFFWNHLQEKAENGTAVVYVDGEAAATYDLSEDGKYEISTKDGNNTLVIQDGTADMVEADCPDGLCVKQSPIDKNGETIVCLPHKVVIEVESVEESEIDAIVQ